MNKKVLYISYDGILGPLGQSQVLAYIEKLSIDFQYVLVTFEKNTANYDEKIKELEVKLRKNGVLWKHCKYRDKKYKINTIVDGLMLTIILLRVVLAGNIGAVHARSTIPGLYALIINRIFNIPYIFDIRGFWADERVDGGLWARGSLKYKFFSNIEYLIYKYAFKVVTLTDASTPIIFNKYLCKFSRIKVIPTCVNLDKFIPLIDKKSKKITDEWLIAYSGSIGTWYLLDEMLDFFICFKRVFKNSKFVILNKYDHDMIRFSVIHKQIDLKDIRLISAEQSDVAGYLKNVDLGLAFIKPTYSKIASAPTKIAEYLACGVPCVVNGGVGDLNEDMRQSGGYLIEHFHADQYNKVIGQIISNNTTGSFCRDYAKKDIP